MNHSLYSKFVLGYLLFGLLGFVTIATLSSQMVHRYLIERQADRMYDDASILAGQLSSMYNDVSQDLETTSAQVEALSQFMGPLLLTVGKTGQKTRSLQTLILLPSAIVPMASAIITVCFPMTLSAFLLPLQGTTILMDTCWFTVRCPDWCQSRTGF